MSWRPPADAGSNSETPQPITPVEESAVLALFVVANIGIFAGYIFAATAVAPRLMVRLRRTQIGGAMFFLTCGLTHLELAVHAATRVQMGTPEFSSWHMVMIHTVQVVAVWAFLTGVYKELTVNVEQSQIPIRGRRA